MDEAVTFSQPSRFQERADTANYCARRVKDLTGDDINGQLEQCALSQPDAADDLIGSLNETV